MNDEFIIYTDINLIELQGVYSDKNNLKQICRLINSTEEIPQYRLKSILDPWRKPKLNKKLIFKSAVHFVFGIVLKK